MDDLTVGTLDADMTTDTTAAATDYVDTASSDTSEVVSTSDVSDVIRLTDGSEVSLDELERGYLRQSDYTRKTQDLSKQRDELAQAEQLLRALESDPKATLEALQRHLLVDEPDLDEIDPVEAELREHREFIEQQRALAMQHEVETELAGLAEQYGEFDWSAVLEFAVTREIPDLEAAYLLWNKQTERERVRQEGNQKALSAKRNAPPVARGSRAQGTVDESAEIMSVMDAWRAAKRELGYE
jgi:hypothetical protein